MSDQTPDTGESASRGTKMRWCIVHESREPRYPWTQGRCWFALYNRRRKTDPKCEMIRVGIPKEDDEQTVST